MQQAALGASDLQKIHEVYGGGSPQTINDNKFSGHKLHKMWNHAYQFQFHKAKNKADGILGGP